MRKEGVYTGNRLKSHPPPAEPSLTTSCLSNRKMNAQEVVEDCEKMFVKSLCATIPRFSSPAICLDCRSKCRFQVPGGAGSVEPRGGRGVRSEDGGDFQGS